MPRKSRSRAVLLTPRRRRAVAFHEAAHVVALWCLFGSRSLADAWIARTAREGEPQGAVHHRTPAQPTRWKAIDHLVVGAAGWVGERSIDPDVVYWAFGALQDDLDCDGAVLRRVGRQMCFSADEQRELADWVTARAEAIVAANQHAVRAIAEALLEADRLTAPQLRRILRRHAAALPSPWGQPTADGGGS